MTISPLAITTLGFLGGGTGGGVTYLVGTHDVEIAQGTAEADLSASQSVDIEVNTGSLETERSKDLDIEHDANNIDL